MEYSGSAHHLEGVDIHCVAEVIVTLSGAQAGRRGSGYLVSSRCVLTAAHVVANAVLIRVRLDADTPREIQLGVHDVAVAGDLAVLQLDEDAGRHPDPPCGFGTLSEGAAVVEVHAGGFPRFKLRRDRPTADQTSSQYRDLHHAIGWTAVLSNRRSGTLEMNLSPPDRDPDPTFSPWEGMSGSAVWAFGRIVGIVSYDDRREGLGRLTVSRIDRSLEAVPVSEADRIRQLLGLVGDGRLTDVIPRTPGNLALSAYREQVRDLAPVGDLLGRTAELDQLARFCASPDFYMLWHGAPWAGKSALMAWFVLHPPAGVDVLSFFVTGRLSGQADSNAFTDALIDQLCAYLGATVSPLTTPAARDGHRRRLLREAAEHALGIGRRLALVVDGLDEDNNALALGGSPSIASLLPKHPIAGLRIIVSGRSHPPLPTDVAGDHPLRKITPVQLEPSPHATDVREQAIWELNRRLNGGSLERDVFGLIAASGGGLTANDLYDLIEQPPYMIDGLLRSVFGRSIRSRSLNQADSPERRVYIFAHDTLQGAAKEGLGDLLLNGYRGRLHSWADSYRDRGWPSTTPQYLLNGYLHLIAQSDNARRVVQYITDTRRQNRIFAKTGGDTAALAEILAAEKRLLRSAETDLDSLARLAVHRVHLMGQNWKVPANLPTALGLLGEFTRGEALARSIADTREQASALIGLIRAAAQIDDYDRAESLVRSITDDDRRLFAWTYLAQTASGRGDLERAGYFLKFVADSDKWADAFAGVLASAAHAGHIDTAELLLASVDESDVSAVVVPGLVGAVARSGDLARAESLGAGIADVRARAVSLVAVAAQAVGLGQVKVASRLIGEIEILLRTIGDADRARCLMDLAGVAAQMGDVERGVALALAIEDPYWRTQALADLAGVAAQAGDVERGQALALAIEDPYWRAQALIDVVSVAPRPGLDLLRAAESAVETIADPGERSQATTDLAMIIARDGRHERADALAQRIASPDLRTQVRIRIASSKVRTSEYAEEDLVSGVKDPAQAAELLIRVANAVASDGAVTSVGRLITRAEAFAERILDPYQKAYLLAELALVSARMGDNDRAQDLAGNAETTARTLVDHSRQGTVLIDLAVATADAGELELATELIASLQDREALVHGIIGILTPRSDLGSTTVRLIDWAMATVEEISPVTRRVQILVDLVAAIRLVGDELRAQNALHHAYELSREISDVLDRVCCLADLIGVAVLVDEDRRWLRDITDEAGLLLASVAESDVPAVVVPGLVAAVARSGDLARAESLSVGIADVGARAVSLATVAAQAVGLGQVEIGSRLIGEIELLIGGIGDTERARCLMDLAGVAAQMGDVERGEGLALAIEDPYWRAQALADLAGVAAQAGDAGRGQALALAIEDPYWRAQALIDVVGVASGAGPDLLRAAESAVETIADPGERSQATTDLAMIIASNGGRDQANRLLRVARSVIHLERGASRQAITSALAVAAARIGAADLARAWAEEISDEHWRARTFAGVSNALANDASISRDTVSRFLAESLVAVPWQLSLAALAKFQPRAVVGIAEEVRKMLSQGS
ncbi:trypsin-like peptidase domain-containing protein [Sphaerisporangium sp. NPDC088356]|uniref:trypsin-like peptidase domain-containing protein n=1 Tax=Sphaerisporangium sp. NPDC088356 TaxID=3154871 RepID=UPI0034481AB5